MTRCHDHVRRESLDAFCRLDSLVLRETQPEVWNQTVRAEAVRAVGRLKAAREASSDEYVKALVDLYRLVYRAAPARMPKEYIFWLLCGALQEEAHGGPDALVNQQEYLGPLRDRLEAIQ